MNGVEFKARLRVLRRTQVGFAAELGVAPRTVHYWAHRGPPSEIAYLLDILTLVEMPFGPRADLPEYILPSHMFFERVGSAIDRLMHTAAELDRSSEFKQAVRGWVEANCVDLTNSKES